MMRLLIAVLLFIPGVLSSVSAQGAGDVVWVQIEARPDAAQAAERARSYAGLLEDVNGFALGNGWYAISLGPYTPGDADQVLSAYRRQGLIPRDSYIAQSSAYGAQFWPEGENILGLGGLSVTPDQVTGSEPPASPFIADAPAPQTTTLPDETRAEARRNEQLLSAAERRNLQVALRWAGFYNGGIDGAFGRGTRGSMAEWQRANGFEPTGVLTTQQRTVLLGRYNAILADLDLRQVQDQTAGIDIKIPAAKVSFTGYNPPFARFDATDGSDAAVLLISQPGDRAKMAALFEVMQTLEIVPLEGPRDLRRNGFTLIGRNASVVSETRVTLVDNQIKGFTLIWPAGDEERRTRLLGEMNASFASLGGVMDPATGFDQQIDLVSGLAIRKPRLSRSGFYLDRKGTVLTTADAVEGCTRITLDNSYEATPGAVDSGRGIAIVQPKETLVPLAVALFSPAAPRLQSEIAVAGYSYEGVLGAPSVTFGTLSELRGLAGEPTLNRLDISSLPGDAGGPVLDQTGNVFGMLMPGRDTDRQLPENVRFALTGAAITDFVTTAGLDVTFSVASEARAPEDIASGGADMTVLVSCWE
ncbi:serine protease [Roseobacter sp.]|uniref:serine protease n=1 Tax=Roseobacter sp. TaxID=1907202 RepID=UPI0025D7E87D|nr:serine protease [Roseobacter sp.]